MNVNVIIYIDPVIVRGGYRGGSLGAEEPPSPRLPPFAEEFMSSLSPTLSSLYMLDSVCQTPL